MINVDEVTASRLIFAPMGVFFGKCCGNATSKKVGRSTMSAQAHAISRLKALGLTVRPMLLALAEEYDRIAVRGPSELPRCSVARDYLADTSRPISRRCKCSAF